MFSRLRVISTRLCSDGLLLILISGDGRRGTEAAAVAAAVVDCCGGGGGGDATGGSFEGRLPTRLLRNASSRRFRGTGPPKDTGMALSATGTTGEEGTQPAVLRRPVCPVLTPPTPMPPPPAPVATTDGFGPLIWGE